MSKRLIVILALAFVVGISVAAYAEVQNVKVSGDIIVRALSRQNFTLREGLSNPGDGSAFLSGVRLRVDADLTDNVASTLRFINEREWGQEGATDTNIDLDLAFVTLKEFLYSPLALTIGRQELRYGNGLILGDPDTNLTAAKGYNILFRDLSSRKSFDAIKAVLNYDPLVVDLILAKVSESNVALNDDTDLYGINARYALGNMRAIKNILLEGYYFEKRVGTNATGAYRVIKTTGAVGAAAIRDNKIAKTQTIGARVSASPTDKLNLQLEAAYQFGRYDPALDVNANVAGAMADKRKAWATQAIAMCALGGKYNPRLMGTYTFLSGEKDSRQSGTYHGWDAMFEDQTAGEIANAILGYSNSHTFTLGGSLKPMEDVTLDLTGVIILLDKVYQIGNYVSLNGVTASAGGTTYVMTNKRYLGNELDLKLTYDYTEDVQFGLLTGWFMPGEAFDKVNKDTASEVMGSMKVTF